MARPIAETPILYGEDARRFEERMRLRAKKHRKRGQRELPDVDTTVPMYFDLKDLDA